MVGTLRIITSDPTTRTLMVESRIADLEKRMDQNEDKRAKELYSENFGDGMWCMSLYLNVSQRLDDLLLRRLSNSTLTSAFLSPPPPLSSRPKPDRGMWSWDFWVNGVREKE